MMQQEIFLKRLETPNTPDLDNDTEWICRSLGFANERERESTSARIFREVLQAAIRSQGMTTEELAERVDVTRGAVIHHIHNYMDTGLFIHDRRRYLLRNPSLEKTIEELESDAYRIFQELKRVAREIDQKLGLHTRSHA